MKKTAVIHSRLFHFAANRAQEMSEKSVSEMHFWDEEFVINVEKNLNKKYNPIDFSFWLAMLNYYKFA